MKLIVKFLLCGCVLISAFIRSILAQSTCHSGTSTTISVQGSFTCLYGSIIKSLDASYSANAVIPCTGFRNGTQSAMFKITLHNNRQYDLIIEDQPFSSVHLNGDEIFIHYGKYTIDDNNNSEGRFYRKSISVNDDLDACTSINGLGHTYSIYDYIRIYGKYQSDCLGNIEIHYSPGLTL